MVLNREFRAAMKRPNVIIITTEQLRYDCLGFAGNNDIRTPNLDALAAHGVYFPQAICQDPVAARSRAGLLSGRQAERHRPGTEDPLLPGKQNTLPRLLRKVGYHTVAIGKMDLTPPRADCGFETMLLAEQNQAGRCEDDYHAWLKNQDKTDRIDIMDQVERDTAPKSYWNSFGAMPSNLPEEFHSTTWIGDQAVRYFQWAQEPFCLFTSFIKPNHPFDPPSPWAEMYKPRSLKLPPDFALPVPEDDLQHDALFDLKTMTEARFRKILALYYANISHVDRQVGRILATLTARGITNNLFVFCSVNGNYMGQHGLILGGNSRPYDSVLRVPLVIAGLAGQRRGKSDAALAQLTDVMPTILEAAGLPIPKSVVGESLIPQLKDDNVVLRKFATARAHEDCQIIKDTRYKLIESKEPTLQALYDLKEDPYENKNMYDQKSTEKVRLELSEHLEK
jgi:arylsulfatase A-like enzyme